MARPNEEERRKRGQAARANLKYKADHPEQQQQQRPTLSYVYDDASNLQTATETLAPPAATQRANMNENRLGGQVNLPAPVQPSKPQATAAPSSKSAFYQQETAARNKQLAGAPGIIKKPLQWLGHGLDVVQANVPGLADFQQGAGRTLGVEAQTAPLTGGLTGKIAGVAGSLAGGAVNPAALEQSAVTGAGRVTTNALQRFAPKANPFVQRLAGNAAEGALQNAANTAAAGHTSVGDIAGAAALGAGGGALFESAGTGLRSLFKKNGITGKEAEELLGLPMGRSEGAPMNQGEQLALPASKSYEQAQSLRGEQTKALPSSKRYDAAAQRSKQPYGSEPIVNPHTFDLPEATPQTLGREHNAATAQKELSQIDNEINLLHSKYEQQVIDEYKYLKESMGKGKEQGTLIKNPITGEVVDKVGSISKNPKWYQEISNKSNNYKKPSNKELYTLARDRVDNGFQDEQGAVPSWKEQNGYDETVSSLQDTRQQIAQGIRDVNPALKVTDEPLVTNTLKDTRRTPQKPMPKPVEAPPTRTAPDMVAERQAVQRDFVDRQSRIQKLEKPVIGRGPGQRTAVTPAAAERAIRPSETGRLMPETKLVKTAQLAEPPKGNLLNKLFGQPSGLGIAAGQKKAGPYENLKTDTKSQLTTKLKKDKSSASGWSDHLYSALVDDVHEFNRLDKNTEKATGKKLNPEESIHKTALASRGGDVVSHQIIEERLVDSKGKEIGKSLKERLASIPKGKFVDFEDYLINRHAITRFGRDEKVFRDELDWTPEKGQAKLDAYDAKYPQFKEASKQVYDFQNTMLQKWLVEPGIITKEQAAAYLEANPFYVPMKREFSQLEKGGKSFKTKKGFSNQSNPNKKYSPTGSQRKIISPIESMIENVDAYVKAAKRNQVMQAFVKNIQKAPEDLKNFAEIIQEPKGKMDLTTPESLDESIARMNDDFDKVMQKTRLDKDNIVRVMIKGEPVHVKINDKHLLEAVTALGPENGSKLLDAVGWLTNKMKVLTTGANPMFSLTRNLLRDIPQAYIASKSTSNPLRFAADLADAAWSIMRNKELYQEFKSMGGGHSSSVAADRNLLRQSKRAVLPSAGSLHGAVPKAFNKMENFLNAVESAPRLAEFKRYAKAGQKEKGLFESQDVTVNFKRRGKLTRELDKVFPYFNAAVQGLDKFGRIYKDNPVKAATKSFVAITLPTLAAYAWNYDNADYKKVSNQTKDNFILLPKGDGTFFKIAKPKEIGSAWSDIPERLLRKFHEDDPEAFKGFAEQMRSTFTIPGMQGLMKTGGITERLSGALGDTILGPIADIQANKNFMDSPIVPGYLANLSPELQSDARTSSLSKKLGGMTKTSPKELDYLIKQYTGVLGQVGLPMLTPGSGDNAVQSLGNSFVHQITADPVYTNDIMDKFYSNKTKFDQANSDSAVTGKMPSWYNDGTRKVLGRYNTKIGDIRKKMRGIESDPKIKADAKRQQLRMMQDEMNKLAEEANQRVAGVK